MNTPSQHKSPMQQINIDKSWEIRNSLHSIHQIKPKSSKRDLKKVRTNLEIMKFKLN